MLLKKLLKVKIRS